MRSSFIVIATAATIVMSALAPTIASAGAGGGHGGGGGFHIHHHGPGISCCIELPFAISPPNSGSPPGVGGGGSSQGSPVNSRNHNPQ
jgi:hypothetical protein